MVRQLSEKVFYIGSDDLDIDLFESQYIVPEGVSYNSYLIRDSKIAVLDTSDSRKGEEWLASLNEALAGREPDYLVVHHMEPDHSALIAKALHLYPSVKLVASAQALRMLPQFFQDIKLEGRTIAIKEGDTLPLGTHTLHLSKCGFYGRDDDDWACEARRYYFNIVGKYGAQVKQLLKKAAALPIKAIRPLHGPLLEDNLQEYIHLYDVWSRYDSESEGIFIACASIHGGTLAAAEMLAQILRTKGAGKVVVSDLSRTDIAENVEDAFRYPKIILAAASYDAGLFTPMYEFLHRLQIKGWQRKKVGLLENGSWAPSAGRVMKEMLGTMKDIEIVEPMVTIRSRMHREDFPAMDELAEAILK